MAKWQKPPLWISPEANECMDCKVIINPGDLFAYYRARKDGTKPAQFYCLKCYLAKRESRGSISKAPKTQKAEDIEALKGSKSKPKPKSKPGVKTTKHVPPVGEGLSPQAIAQVGEIVEAALEKFTL